jgi:hypothetical protein
MKRLSWIPLTAACGCFLIAGLTSVGWGTLLACTAGLLSLVATAVAVELEYGRLLKHLMRIRRHTVANELQILSGWLQLRRVEEAGQALERLLSSLKAWQAMDEAVPPLLYAVFQWLVLEAEAKGLRVVVRGRVPRDVADFRRVRRLIQQALRAGHGEIVLGPEEGTLEAASEGAAPPFNP